MTKQLPIEFKGTGEVKGFSFNQLVASDKAYLYEVTDQSGSQHYEVFEKRINKHYDVISYPRAKSFGVWAFSYHTIGFAYDRFRMMSDIGKREKVAETPTM